MELPKESFISSLDAWLIALIIFLTMIAAIYVGRRIAIKRSVSEEDRAVPASIVSAMLGLLAFLLAFAFGMSGNRFDARREVIIDEANTIGTAVLRADLYPAEHREVFRSNFREYLETRIDYYEHKRNFRLVIQSLEKSDSIGKKLWGLATSLSKDPTMTVASMQMIPALNQMFDISTTRRFGELFQVPLLIVTMLFIVCIASAFFIGYNSTRANFDWLIAASFCFLTAIVLYITLDLDRPRRGLIQLDVPQSALVELRGMFKN